MYPYSPSLAFAGTYSTATGATSSSTCSACIAGSLSFPLFLPFLTLCCFFREQLFGSDHFPQNNCALSPYYLVPLGNEDCYCKTCSRPHLLAFFLSSCLSKRLCSNRRTHTLHRSLSQGNILPSRGPRHLRPVPLASQVTLFPYVID